MRVYKVLLKKGVDLKHHPKGNNLIECMFEKEVDMEVIRWALENGQDINQVPDLYKEKLN